MKRSKSNVTNDPIVGHVVATSTIGVSMSNILNLIPNEIGKLGALCGILLSLVLIVVHLRKSAMESKLTDAQLKLTEAQLKDYARKNSD